MKRFLPHALPPLAAAPSLPSAAASSSLESLGLGVCLVASRRRRSTERR